MPLKQYIKRATSDFWDNYWDQYSTDDLYIGILDSFLLRKMKEYLPKNGKILEGGCGLGQYVYALKELGYDIEGIDYAEKTINRIKLSKPDLPVRVGDVRSHDYKDSELRGYISLGVVEHFEEGPQEILREIARVLKDGGVLLLSVPYFNVLRRLKYYLKFYSDESSCGKEFYQYCFTRKEIKTYVEKAGFRNIELIPFSLSKGLKDELPFLHTFITFFQNKNFQNKKGNFFRGDSINERKNYQALNDIQRKIFNRTILNILKKISNNFAVCYIFGHMLLIVAWRGKND